MHGRPGDLRADANLILEECRVKTALQVLALVFAALLPATASEIGDKPVGAVSIEMKNPAVGRAFVSEFWFEAAAHSKVEGIAVRPPLRAIAIARNSEPVDSRVRRPLAVISHGNWGTRYSQGWLSMRLVNAGYVVLSTSHPGTLGDDQSVSGRLRLWDRSRDVSFALTEILRHPKWSALIDRDRIAFVGHSFGGWTGVSLAGGKYDPAVQRAFCQKLVRKDFYCEATLKDDTSGIDTSDAAGPFRDDRFKAFYIMATGPGQGFSAGSLGSIAVPFAVDTAKADEILEAGANSSALARLIPGAAEIIRPVGHFAYVPECKWIVGPLLARMFGTPICDDPVGVDRGSFHTEIAKDVIAFFDKHLATK
jgi:predicted dienelactone hydrolase